MADEQLKTLSKTPSQTIVKLIKIDAGCGLAARLAAMGLLPGVVFKVVKNGQSGPFIIEIKSGRLALGKGMAAKIFVKSVGKND